MIVKHLILMGYWIRGKIPPESSNPLNRFLIRVYHPLLLKVLHWPKTMLLVAALSARRFSGRSIKLAGNFYRRSMKATCCICHRRCRGFPQQRRRDAAKNRQAN
ncbi:hypothetical protein ACLBR5_24570 [Escherichia coli]